MSVADNENTTPTGNGLYALFSQLDAQQVEMFYKSYQQWQLEQQSSAIQEYIATIEQQIVDNSVLMQLTQPSPIALATLTRLQSLGVDDVDLLDSMLERGDTWLDHTLQLLEQCERLDVIHGNYTEWCLHALEDAYNWLDSMHDVAQPELEQTAQAETSNDTTEALLIQKLMSEDESVGTDVSRPSNITLPNEGRNTSVPTDEIQQLLKIPSILSYVITIETNFSDSTLLQEKQQKSPKYGLVSRILANVWRT